MSAFAFNVSSVQSNRVQNILDVLRAGVVAFVCHAVLALAPATSLCAAIYTTPRSLNVGDIYELRRDGWSNPPGGATYEGDVIPKTDANTGSGGDNRYFQRHNVARGWPTDVGYWLPARTSTKESRTRPGNSG